MDIEVWYFLDIEVSRVEWPYNAENDNNKPEVCLVSGMMYPRKISLSYNKPEIVPP